MEGQLIYRAASYDVPPGNKVEEMKTLAIKLTIFSPEDLELASKSQNELIRERIVRLTNEAMDQGALLTQVCPAKLTGTCGWKSRHGKDGSHVAHIQCWKRFQC